MHITTSCKITTRMMYDCQFVKSQLPTGANLKGPVEKRVALCINGTLFIGSDVTKTTLRL